MPRASSPADFHLETSLLAQGFSRITGVDEVGRGPLAGPVVAAAVILDPAQVPQGLADSKALSPKVRDSLFQVILTTCDVAVAAIPAEEIDRLNIRRASLLAMRNAVLALPTPADYALIDGRDCPDLPCPSQSIIKGDAKIASIAAASIVAKVIRDRMMSGLHDTYPVYGFASHAGYGTPAHLAALKQHGPCPVHRMSFTPLKKAH